MTEAGFSVPEAASKYKVNSEYIQEFLDNGIMGTELTYILESVQSISDDLRIKNINPHYIVELWLKCKTKSKENARDLFDSFIEYVCRRGGKEPMSDKFEIAARMLFRDPPQTRARQPKLARE